MTDDTIDCQKQILAVPEREGGGEAVGRVKPTITKNITVGATIGRPITINFLPLLSPINSADCGFLYCRI